ncbi:MAG: hypothetical protein UX91_C0014G0007 [Candidatus Amesbacteria bacterium GW2011_GWB1_47_19]|nr:MAG: hypothetical protein UW51_C0013G0006 [Candidatus Amesbacteria bacterium GW2011_GWA1_44_24]KKU30786.1 MAG: hypothetical protein UX46_C0012G0007 [Candidatus Amesbacteria bacterium GW2011_GWC1_46_24]KKU65905.1 MAG: hypothetical protein UX91_C0014G0007 [Candidatus Amesbacteria bacterium GW2011_GWB1_47_19]OGD05211.1 MAG: hypothetical protein A2379_04830 [Candidatus Amesbacteria bacterium RIFOXYB1_FULL_47_13]
MKQVQKTTKKYTVFIDESGTLPDPADTVVVIAAVGTDIPQKLSRITIIVRKQITNKQKLLPEIKFYRSGEQTKKKYLSLLSQENINIFLLVIEKDHKAIPDNPTNFALLCWLLLQDCLSYFNSEEIKEIVFDRHFSNKGDLLEFDHILTALLEEKHPIRHTDSQTEPAVNAADMIAGSFLWKTVGKDAQFFNIIEPKVISSKKLNWPEAKRKLFSTKKSR